ncbi:tRNA (mnm(5)s(2)U34)-methyltransferase [Lederbergia panacisoli]|uniref:tRNA (mnm(5)s(2)U34)-methyltransferase n=1 Tax=Lederbergia panacisoli TaxID=1255251 RepID=UPI00214C057D|nr:class I SAM-dependent methyltransferase [Lederbergia panacisoli]MCR2821783.1 methyltransferase domain-containing protein [Lederbergia panacisoli]
MSLENILSFARSLLEKVVKPGDIVIDATIGNGHDTYFLAKLVEDTGHVYGFDIQENALHETKKLLSSKKLLHRATLFHTGHEHVLDVIPGDEHRHIKTAIFNLGYLPKGDKSVITKPETTIIAVHKLLENMASGGVIILVVYYGHEGGIIERDALLRYTTSLDQKEYHVLKYSFINQINNPPFIIAIEKRGNH